MGITCKPMGFLKKKMKQLDNQQMKEKAMLNKAKGNK